MHRRRTLAVTMPDATAEIDVREVSLAGPSRSFPRGRASPRLSFADTSTSTLRTSVVTVLAVTAVASLVGFVGADARWLAALGEIIAKRHVVPTGVPFAAAPTAHWANLLVGAELIFHGLESSLGDRGLLLAQAAAVAIAFSVLAVDAHRLRAPAAGIAAALSITAIGALPSLAIARVQLFSIALFPVLIALLRAEHRTPSLRIWLLPPLLAVWSNLHGAALVALAISGMYLAFGRLRQQPLTALGVGAASLLAGFLTPAGWRTLDYYHSLLTSVAARRGTGLWSALSISSPVDIVLMLAALTLTLRLVARRSARPPAWEVAVIVVLGAMTMKTSRSGVWLLFFVAPPAAATFRPRRIGNGVLWLIGTVAAIVLGAAVARGPLSTGASDSLIARSIAFAHGTPVLAEDAVAEQVVLGGGRAWVSNPLDAFSADDQAAYLAWSDGKSAGLHAISRVNVILVTRGGPAQRLMQSVSGFQAVARDRTGEIYVRRR